MTDTTDMTTIESNGLPEGFENFDAGDINTPRLKVVQPVSQEGTPGKLRYNFGKEIDSIEMIPLHYKKGRVLFGDDAEPSCKSDDALLPDPRIDNPIADKCAVMDNRRMSVICPSAQWTGEPPPCRMVYTLLGFDIELQSPFYMSFGGSATKIFKGLIAYAMLSHLAFYNLKCRLSVTENKGTKGKYYTPFFDDYTQLSGEYKPQFYLYQFQSTDYSDSAPF